jgi:uncharacterized protein (DUF983 family)
MIKDICAIAGVVAFLILVFIAALASAEYVFAVIFITAMIIIALLTINWIIGESSNAEKHDNSKIHQA